MTYAARRREQLTTKRKGTAMTTTPNPEPVEPEVDPEVEPETTEPADPPPATETQDPDATAPAAGEDEET